MTFVSLYENSCACWDENTIFRSIKKEAFVRDSLRKDTKSLREWYHSTISEPECINHQKRKTRYSLQNTTSLVDSYRFPGVGLRKLHVLNESGTSGRHDFIIRFRRNHDFLGNTHRAQTAAIFCIVAKLKTSKSAILSPSSDVDLTWNS